MLEKKICTVYIKKLTREAMITDKYEATHTRRKMHWNFEEVIIFYVF